MSRTCFCSWHQPSLSTISPYRNTLADHSQSATSPYQIQGTGYLHSQLLLKLLSIPRIRKCFWGLLSSSCLLSVLGCSLGKDYAAFVQPGLWPLREFWSLCWVPHLQATLLSPQSDSSHIHLSIVSQVVEPPSVIYKHSLYYFLYFERSKLLQKSSSLCNCDAGWCFHLGDYEPCLGLFFTMIQTWNLSSFKGRLPQVSACFWNFHIVCFQVFELIFQCICPKVIVK